MQISKLTSLNQQLQKLDPKFQTKTQITKPPGQTSDFNPISKAQEILSQKLAEILEARFEHPVELPKPASTSFFDAEEIAKNVLGFVNARIDAARVSGADSTKLEEMLEQARSGIEKGISEARDILDGMGLLTQEISTGIQKAEDLIFNGLDAGRSAAENAGALQTQSINASQLSVQRQSNSFDLTVTTQDGDTVTLKFRQVDQQSGEVNFSQSEKGQSIDASFTRLSQNNLAFYVEGNLDEDELEAINALVNNIDDVSNKFFEGNVQAAFEQGLKLGFNTDEISGFSLQLKQTVTSVATDRYREVSNFTSAEQTPQIPGLESIANIIGQLQQILESANEFLKNASNSVADLFGELLQNHPDSIQFTNLLEKHGDNTLAKLAERLIEQSKSE